MVHADVFIAGRRQPVNRIKEQLNFLGLRRQIFFETSLLMLQNGDVRVAEDGHAVRVQLEDEVERLLKRRPGLLRQTIDQIGIDTLESQRAGIVKQLACVPVRLDSTDCQLDIRIEVLDAHAQAIESEGTQQLKVLGSRNSWIDLNREFSVLGKIESVRQGIKQFRDLAGIKISRSSAAPVHLGHEAVMCSIGQFDFLNEVLDVTTGEGMILLNHDIASAI